MYTRMLLLKQDGCWIILESRSTISQSYCGQKPAAAVLLSWNASLVVTSGPQKGGKCASFLAAYSENNFRRRHNTQEPGGEAMCGGQSGARSCCRASLLSCRGGIRGPRDSSESFHLQQYAADAPRRPRTPWVARVAKRRAGDTRGISREAWVDCSTRLRDIARRVTLAER